MTPRPSEAAATIAAAGSKSLDAAPHDGEVLPRLLGRYALLRLMVRGGMGEVYLATTIGIEGAERPCVVKRIRRDYREDPSFQARFLDEARVQAQLDDPGVAHVLEATVDDHGDPYVVVEYVEGRSLADVRSRTTKLQRPLPWADAVAVTLEIASALTHVHERTGADGAPLGIVHRDLSPQNVMIGFSGDVKLIDFGTARGENRRCHTISGTVLAKPGYCAPEVARGESATARADIYALGVMLWELVTGRRFLEGDATEHVARVSEGTLRPAKVAGDARLGALGDGPLPAELDRIVAWMTEPVPSARCGRARDAAKALAGVLTSAPRRPVEERGVRARVKAMLSRLYPGEPGASRVDFARLVARARKMLTAESGEAHASTSERRAESPSQEPLTGVPDALAGTRYRLIRKIGEGAMGVVFEAEHVDLGRKVAIKVLQGAHASSPEFVARFRREARAIAGLSHPNLVHVYDFGQTRPDDGGRLFFVMEKLEGETLDSYLDREKGIDWRDGCEIAIKTCRALEAAHAAGLVHRDLKPANLFLTYGGRAPSSLADVGVKLLDFGVAKGSHEIGVLADDPNLSHAGAIFGTPETMAPEQASGSVVDGRADLYALGCVLYHLVTGRPVFDAPSPILMMSCHLRQDPVAPRTVAPQRGIPAAVEKVILRALEKDPTRRFADASEMREALEEACYGAFFAAGADPARPSRDEAIEIMVELGLHEPAMIGAVGADGDADAVAAEAAYDDDDRPARLEDPRFRDGAVIEEGTDLDELPSARPRRGRGGAWFAALLGLSMLGGAGWLRRDVVRHGWDVAMRRTDVVLGVRRGPQPPRAWSAPPIVPAPIVALPASVQAPPPVAAERAALDATVSTDAAPLANVAAAPAIEHGRHPRSKHDKALAPTVIAAIPRPAPTSMNAPTAATLPPVPTVASTTAAPGPTAADAEAKLAAGDPDGALLTARAAKADGTLPALRIWARSAYAAGHPSEAHDACLAWLAKAGDDLDASMLDARALHAAGRDDEALARLDAVLSTHPSCGEAKAMKKDLEALHRTTKAAARKGKHRLARK